MIKPTPTAALHVAIRTALATLALVFASSALAQWDLNAYQSDVEAWIAQMIAQAEAERQDSLMALVRYYREATGDYQTPDALAYEYGLNLYCQNNAAECAAVFSPSAHAARMNDIESWGAVNAGIAASNSSILDASHQGFLDRSQLQDQGHADFIQGAVQGQWDFENPNTGAMWDLPVMPDPDTQYWTPDGQPLSFDFQTGAWYVGTQWGWTQLEPRR